MKKNNAVIIFIVLISLVGLGWFSVLNNQINAIAKFNEYINKAEKFEKKEIYSDALDNYKAAFKMDNGNYEIIMKIADMHYKLEDFNSYLNDCDTAMAIQPKNPEPYIKQAEYYVSRSDYSKAIKILKQAAENGSDSQQIDSMKKELSTKCVEKYISFEELGDWNYQGNKSYITYKYNEKWGMASKDGKKVIKNKFDYIGAYDLKTGVIPCSSDGKYFYVDINGNKKLVGDNDYTYLGMFSDGLASAELNGKYGYIDKDFNEYHFDYEYAGTFCNNVAAVKQGGKWALVNKDFNKITDFIYDEILVDKNGICSKYNVIVVKQGNDYKFIDHNGQAIGNDSFENAYMAVSEDGNIAVKKNGNWGFVDTKGNIVIEPRYEDAKSFSMGLAPVKENDKWHYINAESKTVSDDEYEDAGVFSQDGSAPVKSYSSWNFLILCEYE